MKYELPTPEKYISREDLIPGALYEIESQHLERFGVYEEGGKLRGLHLEDRNGVRLIRQSMDWLGESKRGRASAVRELDTQPRFTGEASDFTASLIAILADYYGSCLRNGDPQHILSSDEIYTKWRIFKDLMRAIEARATIVDSKGSIELGSYSLDRISAI